MRTYLIYRCPYNFDNCQYIKVFEDIDLLSWFSKLWDIVSFSDNEKDAVEKMKEYLGVKIYGFWLVNAIFHDKLRKPKTIKDVVYFFEDRCYINEIKTNLVDYLQVITDDDELELVYYIFDDNFNERNLGANRFLAKKNINPILDESIHLKNKNKGIFLYFESHWHGRDLSKMEPGVYIENTHLKELPEYLSQIKPNADWRIELLLLRALSINTKRQPKTFDQMLQDFLTYDFTFWNEFMKTYEGGERAFLFEDDIWSIQKELIGKYQSFVPRKPFNKNHGLHRIQQTTNMYQAGIFNDDWERIPIFGTSPCYLYDHWLFFESSWAEEYADLANSIDRYFTRWDCLE